MLLSAVVRINFMSGWNQPAAQKFRKVPPFGSVVIAISEILAPIANAMVDIEIQIRDLDQTVNGNPAMI
jgi:hypothetical protein